MILRTCEMHQEARLWLANGNAGLACDKPTKLRKTKNELNPTPTVTSDTTNRTIALERTLLTILLSVNQGDCGRPS